MIGSAALPLAVFLTIREATRNEFLAFLFAGLVVSFPLLHSYTLDVAEADSLLMTTVVLAGYARLKADRPGATSRAEILAGLWAGLATLARPEGLLYVGTMYLAALRARWREWRFWLSVSVLGLTVAAFSAITWREFGMLWPGNHSGTLSLARFGDRLPAVQGSQAFRQYAIALGLSPEALGNVLAVFLVGPIPAEASKYHDFFRHISYGLPLLAVALAYGVNHLWEGLRGRRREVARAALALGLAALVLAQVSLLEGPVTPTGGPVMTGDTRVDGCLAGRRSLPAARDAVP